MNRKYILRIIIFFVVLLPILAKPLPTQAQEFAFDFDVLYQVAESGVTEVRQNITVTNLVTNYYAQNYTLTITSEKIDAVTAETAQGELSTLVEQGDGQTVITVNFPQATVGIGQHFTFTLAYQSRDIASRKGRIWEIIIPGIEETPATRTYRTRLSVPKVFGNPAYLSPPPREDGTWTLSELTGRGITAAYGESQVFTFNLIYYLENSREQEEQQEITLPPDTAFQKVILTRLSETPENVILDQDGNWLARYRILPGKSKKIIAEGSILIYSKPNNDFRLPLPYETQELYTSSQPYWEATPEMVSLAQKLKDPHSIYDFVVATLTYDYNRIEPGIQRLGAREAYLHPDRAVCMEFSDLFVTLTRAAGIPAREVHGFAYTTNSRLQPLSLVTDVLHAWVEYYDYQRQLWIPVDPTWGNTTRGVDYFTQLDFNHLAFAILGVRSDYPFPAGSFRRNVAEKNVYVEFSTELPVVPESRIDVSVKLLQPAISGRTTSGTVRLHNLGQVSYKNADFAITADVPVAYHTPNLTLIPPYGYLDIAFTLSNPISLTSRKQKLLILLNGKSTTKEIESLPIFFHPVILGGAVAFGGSWFLLLYVKRRRTGKS